MKKEQGKNNNKCNKSGTPHIYYFRCSLYYYNYHYHPQKTTAGNINKRSILKVNVKS